MLLDADVDLTAFFRERLLEALERQSVDVTSETELYLVNLLNGFASVDRDAAFGRPLVELLIEALSAPPSAQFDRYRSMGDWALFACGFLPEHLEERGISRPYFTLMGGRAYGRASELAARTASGSAVGHVLDELSRKFEGCVLVLDDVKESTVLRTPQDIVRLYERWRQTRAPHMAERLHKLGVAPQTPDDEPWKNTVH